jgi:serine/threonine-protein kinase
MSKGTPRRASAERGAWYPDIDLSSKSTARAGRIVGRYALYDQIASGGMATVYIGRLLGQVGFARTVAIKRLHPHLATDPQFVAMLIDEARLAARIRHPNVVSTLDVVATGGELFIVMDYVQGESFSRLMRTARARGERVPPRIAAGIMIGVLNGLHAAHEAKAENGEPLHIVHRDVSPQNVMVGVDGVARVLDFGVAKAGGRIQETRASEVKGKIAYMSPEQLERAEVDRRCDIFSASVVLWEALTGKRLFHAEGTAQLVVSVLNDRIQPARMVAPAISPELDAVLSKGLDRNRAARWQTAREMAIALEHAQAFASAREVGEWVECAAHESIEERARRLAEVESESASRPSLPPSSDLKPAAPMPAAGSAPSDHASAAMDASVVRAATNRRGSETPTPTFSNVEKRGVARPSAPMFALMAAATAGLLGAAFWLGSRRAPRDAATIVAASTSSAIAAAAQTPAPATTATPTTSSGPVAASSAPQAPTAAAVPTGSTAAPSKPVARPRPAAPVAKPDCDNPFVIDSSGIRRPRPECFAH